jgi:soluble lytic murein transglycosylase
MKRLRAMLFAAALGTACTHLPSEPAPAREGGNEEKPSVRDATRTDWRVALAQTLAAKDEQRWEDVAYATGWVWPEFQDYRLYYRARAEEYAMRFTDAAALYARVVSETPQSVFAEESRQRHFLAVAAAGGTAARVTDAVAWAGGLSNAQGRAQRQYILGRVYEAANRVTDAVNVFRRLRIEAPASPAASQAEARLAALDAQGRVIEPLTRDERKARAAALFAARAYDSAAEMFAGLAADAGSEKEKQEYLFKRALARFNRRAYTEALSLFERAERLGPLSEPGLQSLYYRAFATSRGGDPGGAVVLYERVIERSQKLDKARRKTLTIDAEAMYKIGLIHLQEGNDVKAAAAFERYLVRAPKGEQAPEAQWWLAWARYHLGDYGRAQEAFARRSSGADDTARAARYWFARCAERLGNPGAAVAVYARLATEAPLHYYGRLAAVRYPLALTTAPARRDYFAEPVSVTPSPLVAFHLARGEALAELARTAEGEAEFQTAAQAARTREEIFLVASELVRLQLFNAAQRIVWSAFEPDLLRSDVFYTDLWSLAYPRAFADLVAASAAKYGTNPNIVLALMREESRYNPRAASPADAFGLLQLIMPTAERVASRVGMPRPKREDLYRPEVNIKLGTAYIQSLLAAYRENYFLAFAGYNGGPQNVNRWLQLRPKSDLDEFVESIPYTETRNYVKKVTTSLLRYQFLYEPERVVPMPFLTAGVDEKMRAEGVE